MILQFKCKNTKQERSEKMEIECFLSMLRPMKRGLEVHIKANSYKKEQVKEIVKMAADIQKEYSCYCTLNVKQH